MKKNFLFGIIIGSLIFSSTCSLAVTAYNAFRATFPIFIDGEEWEDGTQAYVIDGKTYLPLKSIGGALNVDVKWNEQLKRVEIGDCDITDEEVFNENLSEESTEVSDIDNDAESNNIYVGNKTTKKLHLSTCKSAKKLTEDNKVYFSNVSDAKGYTKCKICNP